MENFYYFGASQTSETYSSWRSAKHPQFWLLVTRVLPAVRLSSRIANNARKKFAAYT
jgi:hypothetical protein